MFRVFHFILFINFFRLFASSFLLGQENHPTREMHPSEVKICLNMIVKNETRIIERCLNSVKGIVDCISICDTGSTDNTVEIIEQFMKKNQIPGKVHRHTWKNFGHNRSLSFKAAQETLQLLGFPLSKTFLLLLDADMILEIDPAFKKQACVADCYLLEQKNDWYAYSNTRLIRASLPWECVGVTHEYWACKQPTTDMTMSMLKINDREDGGSKSDKLERDIKLLKEGLKEEPTNSRYMFYLAQTLRCNGNHQEALDYYKQRVALGGWLEEVWYCKYMMGEIYENQGQWDQALHWFLEAYQFNPARAEPLRNIASHYRTHGQGDLAYLFAKHGSRIPYPKEQILFVSHAVYDYQFDEEMSIVAYYIPSFKKEGFEAANRLALKKGIPSHIKEQTHQNLFFYAQNLEDAHFQKVDLDLSSLQENGTYDTLFNNHPSYDFSRFRSAAVPIKFDEGSLMLVRERVTVNNELHDLHRFVYFNPDSHIKKVSLPFRFKDQGIEYCGAMTIDPSLNKCLIPINIAERQGWVCSVNLDTIRTLLKPLP